MSTKTRRSFLAFAAQAACLASLGNPVWAQSKPVARIVVPFAPGGGGDVLGRLLAEKLSVELGQTIIVENRPGGSATIATDVVAKSAPDGNTILLTVPLLVQTPSLFKKLPYDPIADLTPVIDVVTSPLWVAVSTSRTSARTVKEFVADVKAHPGKHSFASLGNGSSAHLLGSQFNAVAGLDMIHVPYKGSAPASVALVAGEVSLTILDIVTLKPQLASGKIRLLAVTGGKRSPLTPEVPTLAEQGYPGSDLPTWAGLFVPSKTSPEIVRKLHAATVKVLHQPDVVSRLGGLGYMPGGQSQESFARGVGAEKVRWAELIGKAGIQPD
ncbi:tripartite tricarboxylate transporter substrate binding protein [Cupriavidus sp. AcVe19-1a]|uniref:Bug family tripartite tricarboxylate transporter substrate binding protein n=1 Tax=Cupriavidus sp. AcVe19-1a TaxID=2821359 RepID=UPI001AE645E8|nr:tripartite tricarboxylate transporter substrate binding protein [Cupriavidus sp. AcVe19-1a]MBP0630481.1 tripartite tricarboxylate transporter substrate binding protein [Cupriavidus sp. AcVe19-1a]